MTKKDKEKKEKVKEKEITNVKPRKMKEYFHPIDGRYRTKECTNGISVRDWFAGMALMGYRNQEYFGADSKLIAKKCYQDADALLAERDR